jgi:hypothetical protein
MKFFSGKKLPATTGLFYFKGIKICTVFIYNAIKGSFYFVQTDFFFQIGKLFTTSVISRVVSGLSLANINASICGIR